MIERMLSPAFAVPAVAALLLVLVVALSALDARAGAWASVEDVARAYFDFGYARGQQDTLEGATIVGEADKYNMPPITREQLIKWREARQKATATLEAAR